MIDKSRDSEPEKKPVDPAEVNVMIDDINKRMGDAFSKLGLIFDDQPEEIKPHLIRVFMAGMSECFDIMVQAKQIGHLEIINEALGAFWALQEHEKNEAENDKDGNN